MSPKARIFVVVVRPGSVLVLHPRSALTYTSVPARGPGALGPEQGERFAAQRAAPGILLRLPALTSQHGMVRAVDGVAR
ncbi:MAG TPA: hypothetical protein VIV12_22455 [Streptosporangiaceae bacterium]